MLYRPLSAIALSICVLGVVQAAPASAPVKKLPSAEAVVVSQMIVKLRPTEAGDRVNGMSAERARRLGDAVGKSLAPLRAMSGDAAVVKLAQPLRVDEAQRLAWQLARDPAVEWAAPDLPVRRFQTVPPDANFSTRQWNYLPANTQFASASLVVAGATINFSATGGANGPLAWSITRGTPEIRVAVVDSGITLSHPDLIGSLLSGYDFVSDDALSGSPYNAPLNFVANDGNGRDPDPTDPGDWVTQDDVNSYPNVCTSADVGPSTWHGTHMAGLIAAAWTKSLRTLSSTALRNPAVVTVSLVY